MNYARQYPRFWLAYTVFSVAMLLINTVHDFVARPGSIGITWLAATAFAVLGLRPLYGYVRQRRYDPLWLWKVVFVIHGAISIAVVLVGLFVAVSKTSPMPVLFVVLWAAFAGPYLLALHQYIYRSAHLWAAAPPVASNDHVDHRA